MNTPPPATNPNAISAPEASAADPPSVLSVRLNEAIRSAQQVELLYQRALVSGTESLAARSQVNILLARLEARRDDLGDQIELLKAQLEIRKADLEAADAQVQMAAAPVERNSRLAQKDRNLVPDADLKEAENRLLMRKAERAKKKAELNEAEIRLAQADRQLKTVQRLLATAYKTITKTLGASDQDQSSPPPPGR